jgi:hypothetical protein
VTRIPFLFIAIIYVIQVIVNQLLNKYYEILNAYDILGGDEKGERVRKFQKKGLLERRVYRRVDDSETDLKEKGPENLDWIYLVQQDAGFIDGHFSTR